jgi:hypothetical protein
MDDFDVLLHAIMDVSAKNRTRMLGALAGAAGAIVSRLPEEERRNMAEVFVSIFYDRVLENRCRHRTSAE